MKKDRDNQKNKPNTFRPLSTTENIHDALIPEEFPEGPLGSPINKETKVVSKSTEWEEGQQRTSAFTYSDKDQHDDIPRKAPDAHPLHDE